ncbi:MAG: type II secretion system protein [Patescibacteria group bacterium]|nr:type II secretion system GspH family protein [Patescibacteria group bacterium]
MKKEKQIKKTTKSCQGLSLIGILVALVIISVALVAGLGAMMRGIKDASVAKNEITASALAEEGVELVKNIRDSGDNYCLGASPPILLEDGGGFKRVEEILTDDLETAAIDNSYNTYRSFDDFLASADNLEFKDSNAGLCRTNPDMAIYSTCDLSNAGLEFIRKIEFIRSGDSRYTCQTDPVGGQGGITVIATVYWKEKWENDPLPVSVDDERITDDNNNDLHKITVAGCLYDWRPE